VARAFAAFGLFFASAACATRPPLATHPDASASIDGAYFTDAADAADDASAAGDVVLDAGREDATVPSDSGTEDVGADASCAVFGAPGSCMLVSACAALGDHTSYAGHCPGPSDIECCIETPSPSDNPPVPAGYKLMMQSEVTPEMTTWAVEILDDPTTYPMFSTTTRMFGTKLVLARVEWHPPDFQNHVVHRGVTLYEPI
jgi:hypothetical protein